MKHKIPLEILEIEKKNYHSFVELRVNEVKCRLLLDTGASKTVFDQQRVLKFTTQKKIKVHDSKSVGLGTDEMETHIVKLRRIEMNRFKLNKMEVAVLPISHVNVTYKHLGIPEIDGVLGSDFLMKYKAIIDYKKSRLMLES